MEWQKPITPTRRRHKQPFNRKARMEDFESIELDYTESWLNRKWRPMMAWSYMIICLFDFIVAPVLWSMHQAYFHGVVQNQWQPLTLQGAGLFHLSMGAILGITAWGRSQEKMAFAPYVMPDITGQNGQVDVTVNAGAQNPNRVTVPPPPPISNPPPPPPLR